MCLLLLPAHFLVAALAFVEILKSHNIYLVLASFRNEWANVQVNRIHDLLDINNLRLATDGVDPMWKTMVWNLSQNVDRDTMGRLVRFC